MKKLILSLFALLAILISCTLLFANKNNRADDDRQTLLQKVESGNINDPLLVDSIVKAMQFATTESEIKWYNGDFFYIDLELPAFIEVRWGYEDVDTVIAIPVEERKFINHPYVAIVAPSLGYTVYQKIMEMVSAQRKEIDFLKLYQNNKFILHKALSKEMYQTQYRPMVNILLRAYHDIQQDSTLMPKIEQIMKEHEKIVLEGNLETGSLGIAYEEIKTHLGQETLDNYINNNPISVLWCYPFWLRRMQEGKTDDIYKTLLAIQEDYNAI